MRSLHSVRTRFVVGSLLWTAGLLAMSHLLAIHFLFVFPVLRTAGEWTVIIVVAAALMAVGVGQVRRAFSVFDRLRARLADVHGGRADRVDGTYPGEVQPLVDDLNALLEHRDAAVRRALMKAGDLAHGLKTPLAVLAQEAERADAAGRHELAAAITQQVGRMRRQVDYHLAHARAAASGATPGARAPVLASAEGLVRTLRRLHGERKLALDIDIPPGHAFHGQREDLDEMLGNLLDNACTWAASRVRVSSTIAAGRVVILVDDDGTGIEPAMRDAVLQRGVRADEAAPGTGFGLAIVRDLAELYGGAIALETSPLGGVRARLELPAVALR